MLIAQNNMKQRNSYLIYLCFLLSPVTHAQPVQPMPAYVLTTNESTTSTSLYIEDSNQVMVFRENKCWWFHTDGSIIRGPVSITKDAADIRIGEGIKKIGFCCSKNFNRRKTETNQPGRAAG